MEIPKITTKKKWCRSKALMEEKNSFDELISKLDTTEERIHDLKDMSIETSEVDGQRKKKKE